VEEEHAISVEVVRRRHLCAVLLGSSSCGERVSSGERAAARRERGSLQSYVRGARKVFFGPLRLLQ
jgi:hypothetical protein